MYNLKIFLKSLTKYFDQGRKKEGTKKCKDKFQNVVSEDSLFVAYPVNNNSNKQKKKEWEDDILAVFKCI